MESYVEIVPGVYLVDGTLKFCPGCGVVHWHRNPMDEEAIREWCITIFGALHLAGVRNVEPHRAEAMAAAYIGSEEYKEHGRHEHE